MLPFLHACTALGILVRGNAYVPELTRGGESIPRMAEWLATCKMHIGVTIPYAFLRAYYRR